MRNILLTLLLLSPFVSNANVAVDNINEAIRKSEKIQATKNIFKEFEFIYIFKSTCPHCKRFTPVIRDFTQTFNVPITAYSVDGGKAPGLESKLISPDIYNTLFTEANYKPVVPALFLFNKNTHQVYAVTFGEATALDLVSRLEELLAKIKERYDA